MSKGAQCIEGCVRWCRRAARVKMNGGMVQCSRCPRSLAGLAQLEIHVAERHLNWVPYGCPYCAHVWMPSELALRQHSMQAHPHEQMLFTYKPDDRNKALLNAIIQESFMLTQQRVVFPPVAKTQPPDENTKPPMTFASHPYVAPIAATKTPTLQTPTANNNAIDNQLLQPKPQSPMPDLSNADTPAESIASPALDDEEEDVKPPRVKCEPIDDDAAVDAERPCAQCGALERADGFKKHVYRRHMTAKLLRCPYCKHARRWYSNLLEKHVREKHPARPLHIKDARFEPSHAETAAGLVAQCFPDDDDVVQLGPPAAGTVFCRLCSVHLDVRTQRRFEHIWARHMPHKLAECGRCDFASDSQKLIEAHVRRKHPSARPADQYVLNKRKYQQQYDAYFQQCFGKDEFAPKPPAAAAPWPDADQTASSNSPRKPAPGLFDRLAVKREPTAAAQPIQGQLGERAPEAKRVKLAVKTPAATGGEAATRGPQSSSPPTTKKCSMCTNTVVQPDKTAEHVWKRHMPSLPLCCKFCQHYELTQAAMRGHVRSCHPSLPFECIDLRQSQQSEFVRLHRRCFGDAGEGASAGCDKPARASGGGDFCAECKAAVSAIGNEAHTYRHLSTVGLPRFTCSVGACQFYNYMRSAMTVHVKSRHGFNGDVSAKFVDHAAELSDHYAGTYKRCFETTFKP